jgi:hypothetical protein
MAPLATMRRHLHDLRAALAELSPTAVTGTDAACLVALGVEIERLEAAVRTRFALRVTRTGAYEATGHKTAAGWLAEVAGEPVGRATGVLETAGHLNDAPEVAEAFCAGRLSLAQAGVAARAGAMDPSSQGELVATATAGGSFKDLKDQAARVQRRREGEQAVAERERRAYRGRYLRTWQPREGGLRLEAWLTTAEGARVRAALDQEAAAVFSEARRAGAREAPERYLADALVRLAAGERTGPVAQVALRVDVAALRRGAVDGDEACEIPGVGQVPVEVARDLMGDALYRVVVADGVDVRTVTSTRRTIPASLRAALHERDRTCAVPGCSTTRHLEIDHVRPFALGGPTELANTVRLCRPHHAMKTYEGFRLLGAPGSYRWVGPGSRAGPAPPGPEPEPAVTGVPAGARERADERPGVPGPLSRVPTPGDCGSWRSRLTARGHDAWERRPTTPTAPTHAS